MPDRAAPQCETAVASATILALHSTSPSCAAVAAPRLICAMTPTPLPSNRSFGLLFSIVFALAGGYIWWKHPGVHAWRYGLLAASGLTLLVTLVVPSWLVPFNRAWMALAGLLHRIVSPLVLGLIFYGMFTPIAWGMRLAGRDIMKRRFEPQSTTYWQERDPPGPDPDGLPNQF